MSSNTGKEKSVSESEAKVQRKQRKAQEKCFNMPVDVSRISMTVIKQWLTRTLDEYLPDDDVALEFIYELLVGAKDGEPDIRAIREQMDDFIGKEHSRDVCLQLWQLLLSAQESPDGVPQILVDKRKETIERDDAARKEAHLILEQLRPKGAVSISRFSKSKAIIRERENEKPRESVSGASRVTKPDKKTNYNRA